MREEGNTYKLNVWQRISLFAAMIILLSFPIYMLLQEIPGMDQAGQFYAAPQYTGGQSCIECHEKEYHAWKGSHHDLAMMHATEENVLGDFDNAVFIQGEREHRFYRKDGGFFVYTDGPDGEMAEFEVKYTFGYTPLQQYLVPFEGGKLQCLALTWDSNKNEWYHMADTVYSNQDVDHTNWLHWTNQAQNWNGMCADCHSTRLEKGYDFAADTFNTTWSDINVHCEACHGAGSEHIKWASLPDMARQADESYGLLVQTNSLDNIAYVNRCARCHTRRSIFSDWKGYTADLLDYMSPTLLIEPYYFPDGQILEEDYVYASFTHSKMYMTDVKCNDCHDVHSLQLVKEGIKSNALCLQCHRADIYDVYDHHFHKKAGEEGQPLIAGDSIYEVGSGALCVNCHMTGRYYMGVDFRRDHSFRIPRPDLTVTTASPNACNGCHAENTSEWAASYIDKWYGLSRRPHFGQVFAKARTGDTSVISKLVEIALDELFPVIVRATAIYELEKYNSVSGRNAIMSSLSDPESMIRHQAVQSFLPESTEELLERLSPMLNDPVKAVRMQSAFRLSSIPVENMDSSLLREFYESLTEYREAMEYTGEFAASRHNLGVIFQNLGMYDKAADNYTTAIEIDNEFFPSMANLSVTYNQMGKNDEAEALLRRMIRDFPDQAESHYSLGLLLAEKGQYEDAMKELIIAAGRMPENDRIWYNLAQLYIYFEEDGKFVESMEKALQINPQNGDYLYAMAQYYYRIENAAKLKEYAFRIKEIFPGSPLGQQLLDMADEMK
jgi:predicted CXXCH cytochrome family protein